MSLFGPLLGRGREGGIENEGRRGKERRRKIEEIERGERETGRGGRREVKECRGENGGRKLKRWRTEKR